MLAEQGKIGDLVKQQMQPSRKRPAPTPATPRGSRFVCKVTKIKNSLKLQAADDFSLWCSRAIRMHSKIVEQYGD